jgi:hypothetical protein
MVYSNEFTGVTGVTGATGAPPASAAAAERAAAGAAAVPAAAAERAAAAAAAERGAAAAAGESAAQESDVSNKPDILEKFLTQIYLDQNSGYEIYNLRKEAKRKLEDAKFDKTRAEINFLLDLIVNNEGDILKHFLTKFDAELKPYYEISKRTKDAERNYEDAKNEVYIARLAFIRKVIMNL